MLYFSAGWWRGARTLHSASVSLPQLLLCRQQSTPPLGTPSLWPQCAPMRETLTSPKQQQEGMAICSFTGTGRPPWLSSATAVARGRGDGGEAKRTGWWSAAGRGDATGSHPRSCCRRLPATTSSSFYCRLRPRPDASSQGSGVLLLATSQTSCCRWARLLLHVKICTKLFLFPCWIERVGI
jgi:hypothetical protein